VTNYFGYGFGYDAARNLAVRKSFAQNALRPAALFAASRL
jgi:hypothetical protein